jgi:RNA polymerase sigma factor (sigma-70 family)
LATKGQIREVIKKVLGELSKPERLVLILCYYEELNWTQIAEVLSLSVGEVLNLRESAMEKIGDAKNVLLAQDETGAFA